VDIVRSNPQLKKQEDAMSSINLPHQDAASSSRLYRAIWRWHFYAGLVVVPFVLMLAVTGLIILWFTAISPEYGDRLPVSSVGEALPVSKQAEAALVGQAGGKVGQYIAPYDTQTPALFRVDIESGARVVALDPYSGAILQDRAKAGTWNEFITDIHGTLLLGGDNGFGDTVIEIAASLGIVLLATGIFLWWPRYTGWREVLLPQMSPRGRAFWKSIHSVTGFWLSAVILFFLVSGLAWSGVWGGKYVQAWSTFPAEKWDNVPLSDDKHKDMDHGATKTVPWTLEQTAMPESGSAAGIAGLPEGTPATLESIVALGRAIGFAGRFQVAYPADDKGVWTLSQDTMSYDSSDPTSDRTVHVDQYTGKILADVRFADYPLGGKAMAVGIALHEGQMGWWNIAINIVYCLAVMLIAISGIVMWWKRRPAGQLGSPLYPRDFRIPASVLGLGAVLAAAFPLGGAAILLFAAIDFLLPKKVKEAGLLP
jgi:uncharacterized iron-regulated membrane protein